jgi:hypothetical protein
MDSADAAAITRHLQPRPTRKARKTTARTRTAPPTDADDAEVALHRTAIAAMAVEDRAWLATQAVFFMARNDVIEPVVGVWAFPHPNMRYGFVDDQQGNVEYCIMVRLRGSDEFTYVSTGIVRLSTGKFVEAMRHPILEQGPSRGYVMRIVSVEDIDTCAIPSVAFVDGRLSSATHMADVIRRHASSLMSQSTSSFIVARRKTDRDILQRLATGDATPDDLQEWTDHHVHPWTIAEAIETTGDDEFATMVADTSKDIDLDEAFVATIEREPTANVGIMAAIAAVHKSLISKCIPPGRVFVRMVDDKNGFRIFPVV